MVEVISVRFKNKGKTYFFDPMGTSVSKGQNVIVETSKGIEYAECTRANHMVEDTAVVQPLRPLIRIATFEDSRIAAENRRKEKEAFDICNEKILKHGLDMKLVDVEYNFEGSKILFFFTSDGRVDFRELVKDLAAVFKTRIELRQIGVRDEARMLNGLGICGRPFCCAQFLDDFQPVSIKMAKTQGLSLNPAKISGSCGRLMCCLKYEQEAYEELVKAVPKVDSFVETPAGKGMITDVNLLRSRVSVRLEDQNDMTIKTFDAADVKYIGGKAARAEYVAARNEEKEREEAKKPPVQQPKREVRRPLSGEKKSLEEFTNGIEPYRSPFSERRLAEAFPDSDAPAEANTERQPKKGGYNKNKYRKSPVKQPKQASEQPAQTQPEQKKSAEQSKPKQRTINAAYRQKTIENRTQPPKTISVQETENTNPPANYQPEVENRPPRKNNYRRYYRPNKRGGNQGKPQNKPQE